MKERDAKVYIKKLGLENAHNSVKRAVGNEAIHFENEAKLMEFSYQLIWSYLRKYGLNYRVTMYVLRNDGTAQYFYNDSLGINGTMKEPLHKVKEYVKAFSDGEDYILMVETRDNCFAVVSQM